LSPNFVYLGLFLVLFLENGILLDDFLILKNNELINRERANGNCFTAVSKFLSLLTPDEQGDIYLISEELNGIPHLKLSLKREDNFLGSFSFIEKNSFKKQKILYKNIGYRWWFQNFKKFSTNCKIIKSPFSYTSMNDFEFYYYDFHFLYSKDMVSKALAIVFLEEGIDLQLERFKPSKHKNNTCKDWEIIQTNYIKSMKLFNFSHYHLHYYKKWENFFPDLKLKLESVCLGFLKNEFMTEKRLDTKYRWVEETETRAVKKQIETVTYEEKAFDYDKEILLQMKDKSRSQIAAHLTKLSWKKPGREAKKMLEYLNYLDKFYPYWTETETLQKSLVTTETIDSFEDVKILKKVVMTNNIEDPHVKMLTNFQINDLNKPFIRNLNETAIRMKKEKKLEKKGKNVYQNKIQSKNDLALKKELNKIFEVNSRVSKQRKAYNQVNLRGQYSFKYEIKNKFDEALKMREIVVNNCKSVFDTWLDSLKNKIYKPSEKTWVLYNQCCKYFAFKTHTWKCEIVDNERLKIRGGRRLHNINHYLIN